MKRLVFLFIVVFISTGIYAQNGRKTKDIFPTFGNYERSGWIFSPGLTYMIPSEKNTTGAVPLNGDSMYNVQFDPSGKLGLLLEANRFMVIDNSNLINTFDFGFGFKLLRGVEKFEATLRNDAEPELIYGEGSYSRGIVYANLNFSKITQFSDNSFLRNSLGLNADYTAYNKYGYEDQGLLFTNNQPENLKFQLHYKLGFGFKVGQRFLIEPNIETPILSIYPFEDGKSTDYIFNTRYRPILFRVSIWMLDSKKDRACPPGSKQGKNKKRAKESLWGSSKPW